LPKIDGIVTRLARTLEQLAALGHEALVFAPHEPPETYAGHRVVAVPALSFRPWYPELFLGLPRPRLGRELDRFEPDIVHVVNPVVLGLWGTAIAKQRNLPLLASYHTDLTQYARHLKLPMLSRPGARFLRDVHNQAHVNLVTSKPMMESARGLGIERVRLWPKAVDTELFRPDRATREMRERLTAGHPEDTLLVCVSRLSYEKRIDWLYAPVTQVPGARLALTGPGPAEAAPRQRIAAPRARPRPSCARGSPARTPSSPATWRARSWPPPTPAPTSSCSPRTPRRWGSWRWRRWPAASRPSPPAPAASPTSSPTRSTAC